MKHNQVLESKVIQKFIIESKVDRYLSFLKNEKTRDKLISQLAHFNSQLRGFSEIKGDEREIIYEYLKVIGPISDCYVISDNKEIDAKRLSVKEALSETIGMGLGTLLIFGDADLVYYEGEGPSDRWISELI